MKNSKKRGAGKPLSSNTVLDEDLFSGSARNAPYEPSDSEDDYSQQEKMLLEKARSSSSRTKPNKKMAVMDLPLYDDDDDDDDIGGEGGDDDDDDDINMDSDIEGKEDDFNLPDQRAWGKTRKNYYNTDYVDQDYGGFDGEDAQAADLEEQEAREIQKRLAAELDDNDFTLDVFTKQSTDEDQVISKASEEIIKTDLSQLSSRQKLALLQKEAPELVGIITEFRGLMEELRNRLQPAMALVHRKQVLSSRLAQYIRTKYHLVNNYVMNMGFYLLLRARRLPVAAHPVVKRLLQYRQLLQQLEPLESVGSNQLEELLSAAKTGSLAVLEENAVDSKNKRKGQLKLLSLAKPTKKKESSDSSDLEAEEPDKLLKIKQSQESVKLQKGTKKDSNKKDSDMPWENNADFEDDEEAIGSGDEEMNEDESGGLELDADGKRGITRQIEKNKGLTPHRKKELRNPRVRNRQKFRKAQIRRKGQVRAPRTEVQRYGGESSGIKKTVTKSIKIK